VNAKQWRLSRQALSILATEPGLTEQALAERLSVTAAELRPVTGMLLGRGQLERCNEYLVLAAVSEAAGSGE
jgi:hypothetical protein